MHTLIRSVSVSELPPLQLDDCSISPVTLLKTGTLVAVEEVVEAGKFYDVLSIESSHGVGKIAMPSGFVKSKGFVIGSLLGYYASENQWMDLGFITESPEQQL